MVRFSGKARKRTTFPFFASEASYGLSNIKNYCANIEIYHKKQLKRIELR
ncbi:MAG: hypothetical protein U5L45_23590 [Saprospiraceae bacterium]|nr:hypothetical protein [Saprospiraceae bacterium]